MSKSLQMTSLSDIELKVNGTQTIEEVLMEALINEAKRRGIEIGKELGIETGKQEALDSLRSEIEEHIKEYFTSISTLKNEIKEKTLKEFPSAEIIDFKTFFLPLSNELNLFVIFDHISVEEDFKIGLMLSAIESEWLVTKNKYCDIMYIRNSESMDISSIKRDYPFSLKA